MSKCPIKGITELILTEQTHVLNYYGELNEIEAKKLEDDIKKIDFNIFLPNFNISINMNTNTNANECYKLKEEQNIYVPSDEIIDGYGISTDEEMDKYFDCGLELISQSRIGVVILAGGQGVNYPKGMFMIQVEKNIKKSLFQIQIERMLKLINLANKKFSTKCSILCLIMTSECTKNITKDFFENNNYFGFNKDDIIFFEQQSLPCIDIDTKKILLDEKYKIAFAPNGNGGFYDCLAKNEKLFELIIERNIIGLHIYCVDNVLVRAPDPWFVGCCYIKNVDCGNKYVEKIDANESIGIVCKYEEGYKVLEYSEMNKELAVLTTKSMKNDKKLESLVYKHGNICNHYFSIEFLKMIVKEKINEKLLYHVAYKKVPYIKIDDDLTNGTKIIPNKPNAIKYEKFIFDVFPYAKNDEFSPLKNLTGKDSVETCTQDLINLNLKHIQINSNQSISEKFYFI